MAGRTSALGAGASGLASRGKACPRSAQASARRSQGQPAARPFSARRGLAACLGILLGGALLVLAGPRVMASFWLWLRAPVVDRVNYEEPVSAPDLYGLIASRELALGWIQAGATYSDLAAALTVLASFEQSGGEKERQLLERAIVATEAGLARAPADPRSWTRLAYLRTLLKSEPDPQAAQALQLSLQSGPYQRPDFLSLRLYLLLVQWPLIPDAGRARIGDQIELLWREAPDQLVRLAREAGFTDLILAALADAPIVKSDFLDTVRAVIQAK
jgi:hypothetical protein